MFKIVRTPSSLKPFFRSLTTDFHWDHAAYFTQLVLAIAGSWGRRNISNLYRHLLAHTHRTRFNNFLHTTRWDPAKLLQKSAYQLLSRLRLKPRQLVCLVIDDSLKPKRGKEMEAAGFFRDHVSGCTVRGHNFVAAVLQVMDVVIPWGIRLYAKKQDCKKLGLPFRKLTELAAQLISEFEPPPLTSVVVLFDSFYLCRPVVQACRRRGFCFVSVLKGNRNLFRGGRKLKAGRYLKGYFARARRCRMRMGSTTFETADAGWLDLAGVGRVHVVCSRYLGEKKILGLATDLPDLTAGSMVRMYARRWCIEQFFKDGKQLLGLGQYQNGSYRAAVNHLHLVCFAHALLTHLRLRREGAKGQRKMGAQRSLSIGSMQNELRRIVFLDVVAYLQESCHSGDSFVKELERLWAA